MTILVAISKHSFCRKGFWQPCIKVTKLAFQLGEGDKVSCQVAALITIKTEVGVRPTFDNSNNSSTALQLTD